MPNTDLKDSEILINNSEITNTNHDAILNTLDRWYDIPNIGKLFYSKEAFQQSIRAWDGIPIIFAKDHPDLKLFSTNPAQALKDINGIEVGKITVPKVDITGHPRAMGTLQIDNPLLDNLIKLGKISHSTGFICNSDAGGRITKVIPNHLLVFVEDDSNMPRDKGALILNKDDSKKPYGDVEYADPGYQEDGVHRYPLDTEKHVRAAWSYINMPKNQKAYSADQLTKIKAKIESAAKKFGITIANMEIDMANKDYSKEDMSAMLDFMKANPGMMDKTTMDKMYAAMDGANQKEYMKGVLKDLQSHPEMVDDEMKSMMKGMKNKEQETKMTEGKEVELTKQLEISNKEKETLTGQIEGLKKEIANKDGQLKVFEQKETERIKATTESRWQTIVNSLPKGIRDDKDRSAKLRTEFETDPQGFNVTLLEIKNTEAKIVQGLPGEEGKSIVNAEQEAKTKAGFTVGGAHTTEA